MTTQKLFRPVGRKELELIIASDSTAYPPRLDWQPIFYPVLNYNYAQEIAVKWNLDDEFSSYCGFVTEFEIQETSVQKYNVENVGNASHNELWIPADDLEQFNQHIVGPIQVSGRFYGKHYDGKVDETSYLQGLSALEQLQQLEKLAATHPLNQLVTSERFAILINWTYWQEHSDAKPFLDQLQQSWKKRFPTINL